MKWHELNEIIRDMSEGEIKQLITQERRRSHPRPSYLIRLHQRYCALRDARERIELLSGLG